LQKEPLRELSPVGNLKPPLATVSSRRLFFSVMRLIRQHPFFSPATPLALLAAYLFYARTLCRHLPGLPLFDFIQQEPSGEKPIEALLTRCLTFDLKARRTMYQHHARRQFVNVLAPVSS
jgi:hypothetical protein